MPKPTRIDAQLIYSASETDANMLWATRFFAPDPFIFIKKGRKTYLVMNDLEIDRAKSQASVNNVLSYSEYARRWQQRGIQFPPAAEVLVEVFKDLQIQTVEVPSTFPLDLADRLRNLGIKVNAKADPFWPQREIKTEQEIGFISESLRAAERGMEAGIDAVRRSEIRKNEYLYFDGTPLTSEILKRIINTTIMAEGYVPSHTIVSSGDQCVDPHNQGAGPIRANTSIIMDIFPRSQKTGYFGDITRTVVRGRASEAIRKLYATVLNGQKIAFDKMRAGVATVKVHEAVQELFVREGYKTAKRDGRMQGFFHGTGHGLGLEIHESPRMGPHSAGELRPGQVITVEPGLYYPGLGGVRLEDVAVITEKAPRNLTRFEKVLEI